MTSIAEIARKFFEACETGKGWEGCKQYGMNSGIPFIRIADRVEVSFNLKANRVSGPPVKLD